jgi:hypothetical protein
MASCHITGYVFKLKCGQKTGLYSWGRSYVNINLLFPGNDRRQYGWVIIHEKDKSGTIFDGFEADECLFFILKAFSERKIISN